MKTKTKTNDNYDYENELENEYIDSVPLNGLKPEAQNSLPLRAKKALDKLNAMAVESVSSTDLIGKEFDILNAFEAEYEDIPQIVFLIYVSAEDKKYIVRKKMNVFNQNYLNYFDSFEGEKTPLFGYTFAVDERFIKAGNPSIILRKL